MKRSSFHQNIFLFCCILTFMPQSKIEATEEDSDEYLDTAKKVVACPGDGKFFFSFWPTKSRCFESRWRLKCIAIFL